MKKYVSPTSCDSSTGNVRGAVPFILGALAGAAVLGAAGAAGGYVANKMMTDVFGVSKFKIDTLKIMNNLKVEAYA